MKRFLTYWAIWTVVTVVAVFFFAGFLLEHVYGAALLAAAVFAVISSTFESQSDRIKSLEERVETLEKDAYKENGNERV